MNGLMLVSGFSLFFVGWYFIIHPENNQVRNLVSRNEWRTDPSRAASMQKRYVRYLGYSAFGIGVALMIGGMIL